MHSFSGNSGAAPAGTMSEHVPPPMSMRGKRHNFGSGPQALRFRLTTIAEVDIRGRERARGLGHAPPVVRLVMRILAMPGRIGPSERVRYPRCSRPPGARAQEGAIGEVDRPHRALDRRTPHAVYLHRYRSRQ